MQRTHILRALGVPFEDAGPIALHLEERCKMHRRIGAAMLYSELGLDLERWAELYRRVARHVGGKHQERLRAVLERLDLVVLDSI